MGFRTVSRATPAALPLAAGGPWPSGFDSFSPRSRPGQPTMPTPAPRFVAKPRDVHQVVIWCGIGLMDRSRTAHRPPFPILGGNNKYAHSSIHRICDCRSVGLPNSVGGQVLLDTWLLRPERKQH